MKKTVVSIAAVIVMCISCLASIGGEPAFAEEDQGFVIDDYQVSIQVHENNTMDITENIDADFYLKKHGIYRTIPVRLDINPSAAGGEDRVYSYGCSVENVAVAGREWSFEDSGSSATVIKIGDPDKLVRGRQSYSISYRYVYPDDRIDDFDFIYHNLLGDQWSVPIKEFSFVVKFDKALPETARENLRLYSGSRGAAGNELTVSYDVGETSVSGYAFGIQPGEAITLMSVLPDDYFVGEKSRSPVPSAAGLVIALAGVVTVLIFRLRTRRKKPVPTVEFHPLEGLSPAEVGTIMDETADSKDVLSLIPWFGARGYLTVRMVEKKVRKKATEVIELTRVKDLPDSAPAYQKDFFNLLFKDGDVRVMYDLDEEFGKEFRKVSEELNMEFKGERKLSTGSGKSFLMSLIISVGAAMFYGFSSEISPIENVIPGIMALTFMAVTVVGGMVIKSGKYKITGPVFMGIFLIAELLCIILFCMDNCMFSPTLCIAVFVICGAGSVIAAGLIVPTDYKVEMLGKLLGLKEFISVAELDRLNMLMEENPGYFYEILPYAMAFNLEEKWSGHFESIKMDDPEWLDVTDVDSRFSAVAFCSLMNSTVSEAVSSSVSSGSGGGAGGGGGGGGGGSW
ncbi:MAG: DUF2207 domain-containing protein [Lentihominibacter sp.]